MRSASPAAPPAATWCGCSCASAAAACARRASRPSAAAPPRPRPAPRARACGGPRCDAALRLDAATLDADLGGLGPARRHGAEIVEDAVARALEALVLGAASATPGLPLDADRVAVAMSGGVDSVVAAMLLRDAGYDVVGVTMRLWHDPAAAAAERSCCSPETVRMARAGAHALGLPHVTLDVAERFRAGVVEDFIAGYRAGRTPNPCVTCNGTRALPRAGRRGGARGRAPAGHRPLRPHRRAGRAASRSFRAPRTRARIRATCWPCSSATSGSGSSSPWATSTRTECAPWPGRPACRAPRPWRARRSASWARADTPPSSSARAAWSRASARSRTATGRLLGTHGGYWRFTVGQRKGIGVAGAEPLYVLSTDAARNAVVVGPREALATHAVALDAGPGARRAGRRPPRGARPLPRPRPARARPRGRREGARRPPRSRRRGGPRPDRGAVPARSSGRGRYDRTARGAPRTRTGGARSGLV